MLRRFLKPIHMKLERYCCRVIGKAAMARRKGDKKAWEATNTWMFRRVSRLEFWLRQYCYPRNN